MSEPTMPDTGEALRAFLASLPSVTNVVGDRIALDLGSSLPSIRYAMVDGSYVGGGAVSVTWQVECWGDANSVDDGTCHTLARNVVAGSRSMRGRWGNAYVGGAWPRPPLPADDAGRPRDIVEISFTATP